MKHKETHKKQTNDKHTSLYTTSNRNTNYIQYHATTVHISHLVYITAKTCDNHEFSQHNPYKDVLEVSEMRKIDSQSMHDNED